MLKSEIGLITYIFCIIVFHFILFKQKIRINMTYKNPSVNHWSYPILNTSYLPHLHPYCLSKVCNDQVSLQVGCWVNIVATLNLKLSSDPLLWINYGFGSKDVKKSSAFNYCMHTIFGPIILNIEVCDHISIFIHCS